MVEGDLGLRLIAVGDSCSEWVTKVLHVAAEYELAAVRCDDMYDAVADLAGGDGGCVLVVGSLRELARENAQFFRVAARNGARCGVWLERSGAGERRDVLVALRAGVWVIDTIDEVRVIVETWLAGPGCSPGTPRYVEKGFRATEAELDALLGQEADG